MEIRLKRRVSKFIQWGIVDFCILEHTQPVVYITAQEHNFRVLFDAFDRWNKSTPL